MKQIIQITLLLFILIGKQTFSQTISSQKGLTTVVFNNPQGVIKIFLPDDMRSGDIISGRIIFSPAGNTAKQKQKAMDVLLKNKISIGNNAGPNLSVQQLSKSSSDKIQTFKNIKVSFPFFLSLTDDKNKIISTEVKPAELQNNIELLGCTMPTHALTGSPLRINGPFDGNASNTNCMLDKKYLEILAESPRQCIVQYPEVVTGNNTLSIQENNHLKCTQQISTVKMNITAGRLNLLKEEKTTINVVISGLEGLKEPATLTIENQTKEIILLEGGDNQVIVFAAGIKKDSIYKKEMNVQSIKGGNFSVNYNLDLPDNNPPVFADIKNAKGGKRDDGVLTAGTKTALEIGMKKWNDANTEGRNPIDWDCPNCFQCIKSLTFASNAGQVGTLGWGIITTFLSGGIKLAGGLIGKVKDIADKGGDIYKALQDLIDAGEIQVIGFKEQWCPANEYCQVSGMIVYDVKTGCVEATYRCMGTKACCPFAETYYHLKYCLDKDGAVIDDTISISITH